MLAGLIHAERPDDLRRGLRWLYGFVRPHRRRIAGLLLLSFAATLLVLLQPWLTKLLIDEGLLARDYGSLLMIAGAMISVGIAGTVLAGVNRQLHTRLSGTILFALRSDLYRQAEDIALNEAPWLLLFWKNSSTLVQPYVKGLTITKMDRTPQLNNAPIEEVTYTD